jgi:hypothetical protein
LPLGDTCQVVEVYDFESNEIYDVRGIIRGKFPITWMFRTNWITGINEIDLLHNGNPYRKYNYTRTNDILTIITMEIFDENDDFIVGKRSLLEYWFINEDNSNYFYVKDENGDIIKFGRVQ